MEFLNWERVTTSWSQFLKYAKPRKKVILSYGRGPWGLLIMIFVSSSQLTRFQELKLFLHFVNYLNFVKRSYKILFRKHWKTNGSITEWMVTPKDSDTQNSKQLTFELTLWITWIHHATTVGTGKTVLKLRLPICSILKYSTATYDEHKHYL